MNAKLPLSHTPEKVVELLQNGMTQIEVAKHFGVTQAWVSNIARHAQKSGVYLPYNKGGTKSNLYLYKDQFLELVRQRKPRSEIAKTLGVSPIRVSRWFKKLHIDYDPWQVETELQPIPHICVKCESLWNELEITEDDDKRWRLRAEIYICSEFRGEPDELNKC